MVDLAAFFISEGFLVTGLGRRIALHFVRRIGRSSLGLAHGMAATDLVLAPATPSNTARAGGVIFPIVRALALLEGSTPDDDRARRRLGAYLMMSTVLVKTITSAMFITAMAGNPIAVEAAGELSVNPVDISLGRWALAGLVPGLVSLVAVPWLLYRLYPPILKATPDAPGHAAAQLAELGPMKRTEWIMVATFVLLLVLWVLGDALDVSATATAFVGVTVLLVTKVLTWKLMAENHSAWQTLIFFGVLVGMAAYLNELGVIPWIGDTMADLVDGTH